MPYQEVFVLLWEQVKESIEEGSFAKLTLAKTIGKPNLKNIFIRPVYSEDEFTVLLKFRYRAREDDDTEEEMTLEEAFVILKKYLKKPFQSVLVFTTQKDILMKINKKGLGSITEHAPTFKNVTQAESDAE